MGEELLGDVHAIMRFGKTGEVAHERMDFRVMVFSPEVSIHLGKDLAFP